MKRAVAVLALVVAATACGREGPLVSFTAPGGFCEIAARLQREAAAVLERLGPSATNEQAFATLQIFGEAHLSEYQELDRLAPRELKRAFRAQRDFRRRLPTLQGPQQEELLRRAVANGTRIRRFEARLCQQPTRRQPAA